MKCAHCSKSVFFLAYKLDNGSTVCSSCFSKVKNSQPPAPLSAKLLYVLGIVCLLLGSVLYFADRSTDSLVIDVIVSLTGVGLMLLGQRIAKKRKQTGKNP